MRTPPVSDHVIVCRNGLYTTLLVSHQSCRTLAVLRTNPFRVSAANIAFGTNFWKNWLPKGGCCQCTKFPPKFIHSEIGDLDIVTSTTSQNFNKPNEVHRKKAVRSQFRWVKGA